jgi:uncharacterized paraquat-inducible protein A
MYCQSCGSAVSPGLSYCSRCGVELNAKPVLQKASEMSAESLVWSIVAVAVIGMGIVIAMMALLKNLLHIDDAETVLLISFLSFVPFAIAEVLFVLMLIRSQLKRKEPRELPVKQTRELDRGGERQLVEPVSSIVEHTTRTLEAVPRE